MEIGKKENKMIYRVKLRNKRSNTSAWINVVVSSKREAIRKAIHLLVQCGSYSLFEIRKVKKVI